jgi:hypothetical protein
MHSGKKPQHPGKHPATPLGVTPSKLAKLAGCSRALASRLLGRGMSPEEIIARCQLRREVEAAKAAEAIPSITVPVPGPIMINGESAADSFVYHQIRKEKALADLRQIQVWEKRRELLPRTYIRDWSLKHMFQAREVLDRMPDLCDQLAEESDSKKIRVMLKDVRDQVIERLAQLPKGWPPPEQEPPKAA